MTIKVDMKDKKIIFQKLSDNEKEIIIDLYKLSIKQLEIQQQILLSNTKLNTITLSEEILKYIKSILKKYKNKNLFIIKDNIIESDLDDTIFLLDNLTFILNNKNKKLKDNKDVNKFLEQNKYVNYLISIAQQIVNNIKGKK